MRKKSPDTDNLHKLSPQDKRTLLDQLKTFIDEESKIIITFAAVFVLMVIPLAGSMLLNPQDQLVGKDIPPTKQASPEATVTPTVTPVLEVDTGIRN